MKTKNVIIPKWVEVDWVSFEKKEEEKKEEKKHSSNVGWGKAKKLFDCPYLTDPNYGNQIFFPLLCISIPTLTLRTYKFFFFPFTNLDILRNL